MFEVLVSCLVALVAVGGLSVYAVFRVWRTAAALVCALVLTSSARADDGAEKNGTAPAPKYVLIDGEVRKIEARFDSAEKRIADLESRIKDLERQLAAKGTVKGSCVCGDDCKCAPGECPGKCPVQTVAAEEWVQVCDGTSCRWVKRAAVLAPTAPTVPAPAYTSHPAPTYYYPTTYATPVYSGPVYGTCSGPSCGSANHSGWYPGKRLGW